MFALLHEAIQQFHVFQGTFTCCPSAAPWLWNECFCIWKGRHRNHSAGPSLGPVGMLVPFHVSSNIYENKGKPRWEQRGVLTLRSNQRYQQQHQLHICTS